MSAVLVDMDGVIADWGRGYGLSLDRFGHAASRIPRHRDQTSFDLHAGRTPDEVDIIRQVMVEEGFYSRLDPIIGAKTALKSMLKAGHDVRIVTSPWVSNPTCASDKLNWIVRHYGSHWGARVVITSDKTVVRGDYLIDDKPEVHGSQTPTWEHIYFTQPYNATIGGRRRITHWNEWENVIA